MGDVAKKVLIVDDESDILDILESLLEEHFYSLDIERAENGLDAFIKCEKTKYDLILTDHKMPFMTGAAFVIGIKSYTNLNPKTNVVMLSGFLDTEIKEKLKLSNVNFLEKPFDDIDLINLITPYLI